MCLINTHMLYAYTKYIAKVTEYAHGLLHLYGREGTSVGVEFSNLCGGSESCYLCRLYWQSFFMLTYCESLHSMTNYWMYGLILGCASQYL